MNRHAFVRPAKALLRGAGVDPDRGVGTESHPTSNRYSHASP